MNPYITLLEGIKWYLENYCNFTVEDALELLDETNAVPLYATSDGYMLVDKDGTYLFI